MSQWLRNSALAFAAGCGGGLAKSLAAWTAFHFGMTILIGSKGAAALQAGVLYPRVVWGGLWGLLFLLPLVSRSIWIGGLVAGLSVTLVQWVVLPLWWHHDLHVALMPMPPPLAFCPRAGMATALLLKCL